MMDYIEKELLKEYLKDFASLIGVIVLVVAIILFCFWAGSKKNETDRERYNGGICPVCGSEYTKVEYLYRGTEYIRCYCECGKSFSILKMNSY